MDLSNKICQYIWLCIGLPCTMRLVNSKSEEMGYPLQNHTSSTTSACHQPTIFFQYYRSVTHSMPQLNNWLLKRCKHHTASSNNHNGLLGHISFVAKRYLQKVSRLEDIICWAGLSLTQWNLPLLVPASASRRNIAVGRSLSPTSWMPIPIRCSRLAVACLRCATDEIGVSMRRTSPSTWVVWSLE